MAKSSESGDGRKKRDGLALVDRAKKLLSAGDERSVAEAVRCLDAAVGLGCEEAFYVRGMAFLAGAGGEKSPERAFDMFKRGREAEDARCCMQLFRCLLEGLGCSRDEGEAMVCLREAAERDLPEALYILGVCEICAFRAERNVADGIALISRAAVLGLDVAADALERMGSDPGSLAPGAPSELSAAGVAALRDGEMRMAAANFGGWPAKRTKLSWFEWAKMAKRLGSDKADVALDAADYLNFAKRCECRIYEAFTREIAEAKRSGSRWFPLHDALGKTKERIQELSVELDMILRDISLSPSGENWERKWDSLVCACFEIREECATAMRILDDRSEGGTG